MRNQIFSKLAVAGTVFAACLTGLIAVGRPAAAPAPVAAPPLWSPAPAPLPVPVPPPARPAPPAEPVDPELRGVQVPIPRDMRIFNQSGSQCVWCTLEMLGRFNKVRGTDGLTRQYKHATGPGEVNRVLTRRGVKFRQVTGKDMDFLEEWVANKKLGCGIGVDGRHAILVCHFERGKSVKVIDNGDPQLRVQTWDWSRFTRHFSGWVFVVFPDTAETNLAGWSNDVDDGRLYHGKKTLTPGPEVLCCFNAM